MGEKKNAYRFLMGKPEGKRPLGRPRHRYEGRVQTNGMQCSGFIWLNVRTSGEFL
jgi:hypothetical protein